MEKENKMKEDKNKSKKYPPQTGVKNPGSPTRQTKGITRIKPTIQPAIKVGQRTDLRARRQSNAGQKRKWFTRVLQATVNRKTEFCGIRRVSKEKQTTTSVTQAFSRTERRGRRSKGIVGCRRTDKAGESV